ncbi:MAG: LysM peptidoglycan-binding domain-containing protein [Deltaproteobacteria bacterium]|nr:LysM peptidoglycan-binding domain-containing protein [Deltaproteobacteria bacterium]
MHNKGIVLLTSCLFAVSGCASSAVTGIDRLGNKKPGKPTEEVFLAQRHSSSDDFITRHNGEIIYLEKHKPLDLPESEVSALEESANPQFHLDAALQLYEEAQQLRMEGKNEKSMSALDEAYENLLKVSDKDNPEIDQQVDNLRFMISKRVLEIYASRNATTTGKNNAIPLVMNSHVKREIKQFQRGERRFFIESYQRSGLYRDKIVKELKEAGIPEELSWLPLIESGFKVKALSRARALGLWQFIPSTGYKFGLRRDSWIDERLDPDKATEAAIAYMKELHQIFGDWTTVLAAYNCGENRVLRLIRKQKINYLDNFWDLYERLPQETARYVPRFMATLHILKDPEKYGIDLKTPYSEQEYDRVMVEKEMSLKSIAASLKIDKKNLQALNPELRYGITPKIAYSLKVPQGMGITLSAKVDKIPVTVLPKRSYKIHYVKRGETLSGIARKYRTTVWRIAGANNIRRKHVIRVGQRLKIPARGVKVRKSRRAIRKANYKLTPQGTYKVRAGDSLWMISKQFKVSMDKLKKLNKLDSNILHINQELKITNI